MGTAAPPPTPPAPTAPQVDTTQAAIKPTYDKYLDGVKWMIRLPVAILFGTTQFVEKVDFVKHPSAHRLFWWITVVNAVTAALSVGYYFRGIKRADDKIAGKIPPWTWFDILLYYGGLAFLAGGFLLAVIGLINYPDVQLEKNPPALAPLPAANFVISTSGPVRDRAGTHVHTFLVNQTTGEVWQMECKTLSSVRFIRVPVQDLTPPKSKISSDDVAPSTETGARNSDRGDYLSTHAQ